MSPYLGPGCTDEEIQKMKQEAEANADDDKKAKERVDKLNSADAMIFQTEKQLKEFGDNVFQGRIIEVHIGTLLADQAFVDGLNHITFHTAPHGGAEQGLPGLAYHAGTHIGPNLCWWPMAGQL